MKTLHRRLCVVILGFALFAACGGDNKTNSTTNTSSGPASTTATSVTTTTTAPGRTSTTGGVAQGVTDGATCTSLNARGATQAGRAMVCTTIVGGSETRWRPA